ncbi:MAG: replicative DNA helicase [Chloroflexi bacterium]|nr:replicative DNA helicase [Chloroflexota bacterium]
MADVLPPHSVEAEEAVLGSLLIDPAAAPRVAVFLNAEDFYIVKNGWIYQAIMAIGEKADLLTVSAELARQNLFEEVGGDSYLAQLTTSVPTALNIEAYAHLVENYALRRRMINAASDVAKLAYDEILPIDQVIEKSEAAIFGVSDKRSSGQMAPIRKVVDEFFERIEYLHEHKDEPLGIPTGYPDLDKLTGGLQKGDLIIIAARPGVGKTSLMNCIGYHAAFRHRQRVAIFTLEMSNEQLVQRFAASETGIDSQRLRIGDLRDEEWGSLTKVCMQMADLYIFLDDAPSLTPLDLRVKSRRIYQEYGLDLIIVDYLQLMQGESGGRSDNRVQEISYISRALKGIARELKVPLIAGSQLSRLVEQRSDKRPMLSDLRESGCLAGDTLVTLADTGQRVPIRNLAGKAHFDIWALSESTLKIERAQVSRVFSTGVKPVYRLTTRLGRSIEATGNHKFLTFDGWKRLDELMPGERIALPRALGCSSTQTMSDSELALLGHLIGDGCTLPTHAIQYTTKDRDIADIVAGLARDLFGDEISPRIQNEHQWYQVYLSSNRLHTHNVHSAVTDWLQGMGIWGKRSYEKFVPEKVFQQPREAIALFLRHLWATDGCIHLTKAGTRYYPTLYYASSSERLAQDVLTLLLRIGINARLSKILQTGKGRDQYHVTVSGKPDIDRFIHTVGAVGSQKLLQLSSITHHIADMPANTNRDIIPSAVWRRYAVPAMQTHEIPGRVMQANLGNAYCGTGLYRQNLSRERASRLAQAVRSAEIARLAESDIYWDEIALIIEKGPTEVYDMTVPGPHNFVANDIVVHNSIEQDSDIVMFIYRDEVYNPDTEFKNIAEITVAKNRNGPTGKANLFFDKHLTSFKNLAKEKIQL